MKQLAEGVWHIQCLPVLPWAVNAYLAGDVLIDAGARQSRKRILRSVEGRAVTAHALTHAHADHQGASHEVCRRLRVPYWVPEEDAPAAEDPSLIRARQPQHPVAQLFARTMAGPAHPVDRRLREGDEVAGFEVLDTPGHSAGHVVYWRASDGVLILGDVVNNMDVITGVPGLRLPKDYFTPDPRRNRESARRLGELQPKVVLFGHGAPLRDRRRFVDFCAAL